jgi:hypothetical protein
MNWEKKLEEMKGYCDLIVLNIGCLDSVVTKTLFNTFSKVMTTHVITKGSPVNLRTAFLAFKGLAPLSQNVNIDVVKYESLSKPVYERIASTHNRIQILKEKEVIKL